ncbi:hypothetical protein PENTCL1PPCAC_18623, partial [Pristionchus entomophagus]
SNWYYAAVVVYIFLVILALVVNTSMLAVLWRLRKQLFQPPGTFYTVVIGLMAFTSLNSLVQAIFVAPQYAENTQVGSYNASFTHAYFVLEMLSNYGILGFSTLVAANRFSTFNLDVK